MAYDENHFCWHGIITDDLARAKAFYTETLGWKAQTTTMGEDEVTMFAAADGVPRCHLSLPPMEGVPPHVQSYLRVKDVDARTKAAVKAGGTQLVPPTDIPPGRFSVVTTPSGAALSLFHEADEGSAENPGAGEGAIHWTELHSKDVDADLAWLKTVFGFTTDTMPMPDGGTYHLLKSGDRMAGGVTPAMSPEAPAMWLTWVEVGDVDAAHGRVTRHGGAAHTEPMDLPGVGRMAVVAAPDGAVFGIISPAAQG